MLKLDIGENQEILVCLLPKASFLAGSHVEVRVVRKQGLFSFASNSIIKLTEEQIHQLNAASRKVSVMAGEKNEVSDS